MHVAPRYCLACGRERLSGELCCPSPCGCDAYGPVVPGKAKARPVARPLSGILEGLVSLPPGAVLLLAGKRGSGKTTVALAALPGSHVASSEQTPELVLSYAARIGAPAAWVSVPELVVDDDVPRIELRIEALGVDLILDSVSATGSPERALAAVRAYVHKHRARAIVTAQVTKDGETRGPSTLEHDCDVVCMLVAGRVVVLKNRYGPLGARAYALDGGSGAPVIPAWDRYYSVEGQGPDYRLEPWPSTSAHYAAPLVAAERGKLRLPAPPIAVCAQASRLYGGEWIAPPDLDARRRFCALNGISFHDPTDGLSDGNRNGSGGLPPK